jgi:uncharacterized phage-associated protein/DNA-binding transcriptional regulator YiaG
MKSPYTGKEMEVVYEPRTWHFRGEDYPYVSTSYRCTDTGEKFTTDDTDNAAFMQVTNQYRSKYGIPYTDEIAAIRSRYGVSASKMAVILGIGANQWRLYESGEVPSVSNGRMIRSIANPTVFLDLVEAARSELSDKEYTTIIGKINAVIAQSEEYSIESYECNRIFAHSRGAENGYSPVSLDRVKTIILTVLIECGEVFCTKMNKLLFYIDFLSYRERGIAMTGLSYRAIDFGPVPERWDKVYSEFGEIEQVPRMVGEYEGIVLKATAPTDADLLSDSDKAIIKTVCNKFKTLSSKELSAISHKEPAWINHHSTHATIPFAEAYKLTAF